MVMGTRPEAIKLAPVIRALHATAGFEPIVVATAQHRELLDGVLTLFGIVPAVDLDVQRDRQSPSGVTGRVLTGLAPVYADLRPDVVLVQGDTTTTFAASLAAFYARIPIAHVEAGLRTFDPTSPYPEEVNRRLTTVLAGLHLAPTAVAKANLLREGVDPATVAVTGNTVIDALLWAVWQRSGYDDDRLAALEVALDRDGRRLLVVTTHRRESWGPVMAGVAAAVARLAREDPGLAVVVPVHPNPVVRDVVLPVLAGLPNVVVTEPLRYGAFARLMARADVLLTDSGGIQEEGPSLGKPVLVLRDTTERPEAVDAGTVRLIGTDPARIVTEVRRLLDDPVAYAAMAHAINPYGDGEAASRCVAALARFVGMTADVLPAFRPAG